MQPTPKISSQHSSRQSQFLRLNNLLNVIKQPNAQIGAIVGAGISVSAGFSAFRSDNSIFQQMKKEYPKYAREDDPNDDTFLRDAFSVDMLLSDPRVQYRVLSAFDHSMHDQDIAPTLTHLFLTWLAEVKKLKVVVTQNIDDLEINAGLQQQLKENLIQIHGTLSGPGVCVNDLCPGFQILNQFKNTGQLNTQQANQIKQDLKQVYKKQILANNLKFSPFQEVTIYSDNNWLQIHDDFVRVHPQIIYDAFYDDSVVCCQFCGAAIKPPMVLYNEGLKYNEKTERTVFQECNSLLIIGTSLQVAPVCQMPLYIADQASIHIVSKEIDFRKYLLNEINDEYYCAKLIVRKYDQVKYRQADDHIVSLLKNLLDGTTQFDFQKELNQITPLFNFHQGECDQLVQDLLAHLPEAKQRIEEMKKDIDSRAKKSQPLPNAFIPYKVNKLIYKQTQVEVDLEMVLLAIPCLWPPDASIYETNGVQYIVTLMLQEQKSLLLQTFQDCIEIETVIVENQNAIIIRDKRISNLQQLESIIYQPIGGHWSIYCVSYNQYYFDCDSYNEQLDPWSSQFIGYTQRQRFFEIYPHNFCYIGVYLNYITVQNMKDLKMQVRRRLTQRVHNGQDYSILSQPILFQQIPKLQE
ncbi:Sir2_family protein [Hexamita inflata]|uniref:Sir2 family protein n=1 Tax=Hexamita inflata TaxID=28002 RepID=A0AA86N4P9_9EUKA|nr:Sir2 family protein [Hexamita inflata]CAI9931976.1 Sir2 family protein [Hexamita inflata]CAI9969355.1 Sir2 family protein [Hexamita inflata]